MSGYDFKIKIDGDRIDCVFDSPGAKEQNLPPQKLKREPYLETVELFELWLKNWHRIPDNDAKRSLVERTFNLLGTHLWKLALDNAIGTRIIDCLTEIRKRPPDARPPFQVRISVSESSDALADLPWEFIRFPGPGIEPFFLSSEADIVLGRWVGDAEAGTFRTGDGVVRVLFVMSLPDQYPFEEERKRFNEMLEMLAPLTRSLAKSLQILTTIKQWDPAAVQESLKAAVSQGIPVDIVHLIAVCRNGGPGGSELVLGDSRRGLRIQGPQAITKALIGPGFGKPSLVVLHLNDYPGDDKPVSEHFERLAPQFIRAGIPAVLAMQYPMTDKSDIAFLTNFYRKLTAGTAIGTAVQEARHDLTLGGLERHFGAPVLYLQSARGGFLMKTARGPEPGLTRPGERWARDRPLRLEGILENLLEWRIEASQDLNTATAVGDWLNSKRWPEPTKEGWNVAWMALKGQWNEVRDDEDLRLVYEQMLRNVLSHTAKSFP